MPEDGEHHSIFQNAVYDLRDKGAIDSIEAAKPTVTAITKAWTDKGKPLAYANPSPVCIPLINLIFSIFAPAARSLGFKIKFLLSSAA